MKASVEYAQLLYTRYPPVCHLQIFSMLSVQGAAGPSSLAKLTEKNATHRNQFW